MTKDDIIQKLSEFQTCVQGLPEHLQTIAFSKLMDNWLGVIPDGSTPRKPLSASAGVATPSSDVELPNSMTFGEYFAGFKREIRNDDKLLIAGYFIQSQSPDATFIVRDANKCLMDDGVKLSNPSEFCRILVDKRFVFRAGKAGEAQSKFKVSKEGIAHISSLKEGME
jgi:hypothetical protein